MKKIALAFLFSTFLIPGCGDKKEPVPPPTGGPNPNPTPNPDPQPPSGGYKVITVEHGGNLRVQISYAVKVRKKKIDMSKDEACGGGYMDDIVVSDDKKLKNAVVYLNIFEGKNYPSRPQPVLDQKG